MDKRLQQALDFSQYMTTLNNQKRLLLEKFYENCILYYNGGKFTVTPELISYCGTFIYSEAQAKELFRAIKTAGEKIGWFENA